MQETCQHTFDGEYCLDCNQAQLCELCDKNSWDKDVFIVIVEEFAINVHQNVINVII